MSFPEFGTRGGGLSAEVVGVVASTHPHLSASTRLTRAASHPPVDAADAADAGIPASSIRIVRIRSSRAASIRGGGGSGGSMHGIDLVDSNQASIATFHNSDAHGLPNLTPSPASS